jgi:hypothetical protein
MIEMVCAPKRVHCPGRWMSSHLLTSYPHPCNSASMQAMFHATKALKTRRSSHTQSKPYERGYRENSLYSLRNGDSFASDILCPVEKLETLVREMVERCQAVIDEGMFHINPLIGCNPGRPVVYPQSRNGNCPNWCC